MLSTSTPSPSGVNAAAPPPPEEVPELTKIQCKSCGAEAKPYSRFCEACGNNLVGTKAKAVETVASALSMQNQQEPLPLNRRKTEHSHQPSPTIFEPRALSESDKKLSIEESRIPSSAGQSSNNPSLTEFPDSGALVPEPVSSAVAVIAEAPETSGFAITAMHSSEENGAQAKTVVTPLPPFGGGFRNKQSGALAENNKPNQRTLVQVFALVALALLGLFVWWWFTRDSRSGVGNNSSSQSSASPSGQLASAPSVGNQPANATLKNGFDGMVYIPGGKLDMGRDNGDEYEIPVHAVTVSPFYMDRTEVTNEEYLQFVSATRHRPPPHWRDGKFPSNEAKVPVVNVSWDDANAYAQWIGKRLPTETEWEFAARGSESRIYPWGNSWNATNANAGKETGGSISKVGSFPNGASQFGVLDMCGNVWEWTSSSLVNYADQKEIAPGKVIRGGAYDTPSKRATATYRGVLPSDRLRDKTGFRLVKDAK